MINERLAASPCCSPLEMRDGFLRGVADMGFQCIEGFSSWCKAHLDWHEDASVCKAEAAAHGLRYSSYHLPNINHDNMIAEAIAACRFAAELGAECVLVKADSVERHITCDAAVIKAARELGLSPVIQNHKGSSIETVDQVRAIVVGLGDQAPDVLLEVGHFHSVGQDWAEAWSEFKDRITLVHVKDQIGPQSVPYGEGEVDLTGLVETLEGEGYRGRYVLEIEMFKDKPLATTDAFYRKAADMFDALLKQETHA